MASNINKLCPGRMNVLCPKKKTSFQRFRLHIGLLLEYKTRGNGLALENASDGLKNFSAARS